MRPTATLALIYCGKVFAAALLIIINSGFVLANSTCTEKNRASHFCVGPVVQKSKFRVMTQNKNTLDTTQLYYSGGILHNKAANDKSTSQKIPEDNATQSELVDQEKSTAANPETPAKSEVDYIKFRQIFQKIDKEGRKDIQKCLQFGTYTSKVDGIWGDVTFLAINNFKKSEDQIKDKQSQSLLSKIKTAFSSKAICHALLVDTFN